MGCGFKTAPSPFIVGSKAGISDALDMPLNIQFETYEQNQLMMKRVLWWKSYKAWVT